MSRVSEYWDIDGHITSECDPAECYQDYLDTFGPNAPDYDASEGPGLTLGDFIDHLEGLKLFEIEQREAAE